MKKILSLIKACMSDNMSLFRIKSKSKSKKTKVILPIFLFIFIFFYIVGFSNMIIEPLIGINSEYVLLTLFVTFTTIITFVEGIYKSGSLLFNSKDDNLLLSLPIKKSTVLFIRIFKFYVFEVLYNSMFLMPAMVVYAYYVKVNILYYIVSVIALLLLPIIPITISCIIGGIINSSASKFKHKNFAQTIITILLLVFIFYGSYNLESAIKNLAQNASLINSVITKIYYPLKLYIRLVTNFKIIDFIQFILINILIFAISIIIFSRIYFKINSSTKAVKLSKKNKNSKYKIKTNSPIKSLIKKELNRFANTPVFVINTAMGLAIFLIGCILISIKFDSIISTLIEDIPISVEQIKSYIPVILFGFVCFSSLMSSITSSMISLEGKSFSILKSLPVSSFKIIISKVLTAVIIMTPVLVVGDIIMFIRFSFNLIEVLMILISSIILPLVSETIGIIVNLKYPKMDAENDTEVVKQSMSSAIAVFVGMIFSGITIFIIVKGLEYSINIDILIALVLGIYTILCMNLLIYLNKVSIKEFNKISV